MFNKFKTNQILTS